MVPERYAAPTSGNPGPAMTLVRAVILLVALAGAALRFVDLEQKPYWFNEVFTNIKVAAHDEHREIIPALFDGRPVSRERLLAFQQLRPGSGVADVVAILIAKDVKWAPGYFIAARLWAEHAGSSVTAMRLFSAVIGLAVLPAMFWLSLELFRRADIAWMTLALHAVSPLFLRYSQEARPTTLWALCIVVASAALLRAIRTNAGGMWSLYVVALALGLYVNSQTLMVLAIHALYVLCVRRALPAQALRAYLIATGLALAAFGPWLWLMARNRGNILATTRHLREETELVDLLQVWAAHLGRTFVAFGESAGPLEAWAAIVVLLLVAVALLDLRSVSPPRAAVFVILLVAVPIAVLVLPDIAFDWQLSSRDRYFLPAHLGLQLALAHFVAGRVTSQRCTDRLRAPVAASLLIAGMVSSVAAVRAETWWGQHGADREAARVINQAKRPLVITQVDYGTVAPLAYETHSEVEFALLGRRLPADIPPGFSDFFVLRPSPSLLRALRERGRWEPALGTAGDRAPPDFLYRLATD